MTTTFDAAQSEAHQVASDPSAVVFFIKDVCAGLVSTENLLAVAESAVPAPDCILTLACAERLCASLVSALLANAAGF